MIAFLFLYGESGFALARVQARRGSTCAWRLGGPGAILLVHAYSMYVYFYLFTRAALQRLDAALLRGGSGARRVARPHVPACDSAAAARRRSEARRSSPS